MAKQKLFPKKANEEDILQSERTLIKKMLDGELTMPYDRTRSYYAERLKTINQKLNDWYLRGIPLS